MAVHGLRGGAGNDTHDTTLKYWVVFYLHLQDKMSGTTCGLPLNHRHWQTQTS